MNLSTTALALVTPGKGILAADESLGTIGKRFAALGIAATEENRRSYRELLFTTTGLENHISGVILFDETIRQRTAGGIAFPALLADRGIIPGIKVDKGTVPLAGFTDEKFTEGLDGLRARLAEYRELGARFTKWRAVFNISEQAPSRTAIRANARSLALFAALSQEAGLVPIVEPEVLMDGGHSIARCEHVTTATLQAVFGELPAHRIALEHMLLKTSMVLPGDTTRAVVDANAVSIATLRTLHRAVPAAVPGIVFLSGGQSDTDATERLNAICQAPAPPWRLSFSYGRALQAPALRIWRGDPGNVSAAQAALRFRTRCNGAAVLGKYSLKLETGNAQEGSTS